MEFTTFIALTSCLKPTTVTVNNFLRVFFLIECLIFTTYIHIWRNITDWFIAESLNYCELIIQYKLYNNLACGRWIFRYFFFLSTSDNLFLSHFPLANPSYMKAYIIQTYVCSQIRSWLSTSLVNNWSSHDLEKML